MKKSLKDLKVAIVYDRINKFGGAERVLISLKELLPDAPIYTLVANLDKAKWASDFEIIPTFFNRLGFLQTRHEILAPIAALGFESFDFSNFDLVISVTSSDAKAIITGVNTKHICYCLTPTRYLWRMNKTYTNKPGFGKLDQFAKFVFEKLGQAMQEKDYIYAQRPDEFVSISKEVQSRVKKYYKRESEVIYPPVDTTFFTPDNSKREDYYLVVSRLVPYKKIGLVVEAFNKLGRKLVIIGSGSQMPALKAKAGKNITFLGEVDDKRLRDYYRKAIALIFPQVEDFGIVPLESQACGTPVIAFAKGGALETVIKNETGVFFNQQSVDGIIKAVLKLERMNWSKEICRMNAIKFEKSVFINSFSDFINKTIKYER